MDSSSATVPSRSGGGMAPMSFLVALLAAGVGALAWAGVSFFTGYEVGYVAWALGGMVGLAMARSGGRGVTCASTAAVLTVAGIAGGKLLGTHFVVEKELREGCAATFTRALHAELVRDAAAFAELAEDTGDEELRRFMVEHRFTSAGSADEVEEEELRAFLSSDAADLRELHAKRTSYEDWYAARAARSRRSLEQDFSLVQANLDELNAIDLLFVALGVSTAFGIVRRASARDAGWGDPDASSTEEQDVRRAA